MADRCHRVRFANVSCWDSGRCSYDSSLSAANTKNQIGTEVACQYRRRRRYDDAMLLIPNDIDRSQSAAPLTA